jgi:hypothetical protein
MPRALTKEQIALLARHAFERAELDGRQHNERVEMLERHRAEAAASSSPASALQLVPTEAPATS